MYFMCDFKVLVDFLSWKCVIKFVLFIYIKGKDLFLLGDKMKEVINLGENCRKEINNKVLVL